MLKVLFVYNGVMAYGGIEMVMMELYRTIDRSQFHIDFVEHGFEKGVFDDEIKKLGGEVFHIRSQKKPYWRYKKELKKIIRQGHYDVVHAHMDSVSWAPLHVARLCHVPLRIAHSHNTNIVNPSLLSRILNPLYKLMTSFESNGKVACSFEAGVYLFGRAACKKGRVLILTNGIDPLNYSFSVEDRARIRKSFGIPENGFLLGHAGRFDFKQKNQLFVLDVFQECLRLRPDTYLLFIGGDGPDLLKLRETVLERDIPHVFFAVNVSNMKAFYSSLDCFLFPSVFEGLGLTVIEATANGLGCIVSLAIPKAVNFAQRVTFLSLDDSKNSWAEAALASERTRIEDVTKFFSGSGFLAAEQIQKLQSFYQERYQRLAAGKTIPLN